jgi:AcrR family transcriptional regulator
MSGKREQILSAALKLFIEKGFHNTSTANISKEAGVGTGTLFLYFSGKEILINELYKECKEQLGNVLNENFPAQGTTRDKLFHMWQHACEWASNNNEAFRFIYMFKSSSLISNLTREEISTSSDFAINFFQQSMHDGHMAQMDIELLFAVIDGLMTATVNYITTHPNKKREQIIERSFNVFWNGVAP